MNLTPLAILLWVVTGSFQGRVVVETADVFGGLEAIAIAPTATESPTGQEVLDP